MPGEKEANRAREVHSDLLRNVGAHAIMVDEVKRGGEKTFAVIACFDKKPAEKLPKTLEVKVGKKTVEVPLAVRIMEKFRPE